VAQVETFTGKLLVALLSLFGSLPIFLRASVGSALGRLVVLFPTRNIEMTRLQIELILNTESSSKILSKLYASIGESMFECINPAPLLDNIDKYFQISEQEEQLLRNSITQGIGTVALSGHIGNWDLLAAYLNRKKIDLMITGKKARKSALQEVLLWLRDKYGAKMVWRDDKSGGIRLYRHLKRGGMTAAMIDQDTGVESESYEFFGLPAKTPTTIIEVGLRSKAQFLAIFIVRLRRNNYRVIVRELPSENGVAGIVNAYNQVLQNLIAEYPWQWMWLHKRWRTASAGKTLSTTEYMQFLRKQINGRVK